MAKSKSVKYLRDVHPEFVIKPNMFSSRRKTSDGYGDRIPTDWGVRIGTEKRWRRVWATCWSNVASHWIAINGERMYFLCGDFPERTSTKSYQHG